MINENSVQAVNNSRWSEQFRKPLYDSYCFAQIPQTIRWLLTGAGSAGLPQDTLGAFAQQYDAVVLFFVDAFGWRFLERYLEQSPLLRRIAQEGVVSKLTSQFPSTTAAHVTTIHTGLPVGQSGVYEWFYYEPRLDDVIAPLLFSFAGDNSVNSLLRTGISPSELFPQKTLYQDLRRADVRSFVFVDHAYAHSPYSQTVFDGAEVVPYKTLPEALLNLRRMLLERQEGKAYYHLYFAHIDAICHRYGPESPHVAAEIENFLMAVDKFFMEGLAGETNRRTLLLITADHAQVAIDPATTIYLNREIPDITPYIRKNRAGKLLVPAGSPRDLFLHINDGHLDDAHALLGRNFEGRAEVHRVADLIADDFFGCDEPSPVFLSRVGDLVILPYAHESVWWYEKGRFEQVFYGSHGGLMPEEMDTILLVQPYV